MTDAQQWLIDLMAADIAKVVSGIIVMASIIEVLLRLRKWLK